MAARRPRRKPRQCLRCGTVNPSTEKQCKGCGESMVRKRFRMDKAKIRYVHVLARKKGLIVGADKELYYLRLQALGIETCKKMKRRQYEEFTRSLRRLPDAG